MKKFYVLAVACVGLLATACGGNKEAKEEATEDTQVVVVEEAAVAVDTVNNDSQVVEVVEAAAETPAESAN